MVTLLGRSSKAHSILNCSMTLFEIRFYRNATRSQGRGPLSSWTIARFITTTYQTIVCNESLMSRKCRRCAMTQECFWSIYFPIRLITIQLKRLLLNWSNGWGRITCLQVAMRVSKASSMLQLSRKAGKPEITSEVVIFRFNDILSYRYALYLKRMLCLLESVYSMKYLHHNAFKDLQTLLLRLWDTKHHIEVMSSFQQRILRIEEHSHL